MRRILLGLVSSLVSTVALAADPLGLYIGAGVGRAHVKADDGPTSRLGFDQTDTGWDAFAGLRPLPFVGAELQYIDFGNPSTRLGSYQVSSRARAQAAFITGTAPLPFVDLYVKAGLGRLRAAVNEDTSLQLFCDIGHPDCRHPRSDTTNTRFGWGLGLQLKLSSLGIRAEYVRFSSPNGDPDLLSAAILVRF